MSMIADEYWLFLNTALQHSDPFVRKFAEQTKSIIRHLGSDLVADEEIIDELSKKIEAVYQQYPELNE